MQRVLRPGGRLLTTYLAHPRGILQRIGVATTLGLQLLSKGVQVIELEPVLERSGFSRIQIVPCPQKGLPIELASAEKSMTPL
jgi:hypothetical protein